MDERRWTGRAGRTRRPRRLVLAATAAIALTLVGTDAATAANAAPADGATAAAAAAAANPTLTGPVTGGAHGFPFGSSALDLAARGYVEDEFFMEGTATAYTSDAPLT